MKSEIQFLLSFTLVILAVYGLHLWTLQYLGYPSEGHLMLEAYLMNYFLALFVYLLLYFLRRKWTAQLGFVFMGGSLLKFLLFFLFFYPVYKTDDRVSTLEFTSFFIPYAICLIAETLGVIKFLKK